MPLGKCAMMFKMYLILPDVISLTAAQIPSQSFVIIIIAATLIFLITVFTFAIIAFNAMDLSILEKLVNKCRRLSGLMVGMLNSVSCGLGLSTGWSHCVMFLGKTRPLFTWESQLFRHPDKMLGGGGGRHVHVTCNSILSRVSRNTSSCLMLWKL